MLFEDILKHCGVVAADSIKKAALEQARLQDGTYDPWYAALLLLMSAPRITSASAEGMSVHVSDTSNELAEWLASMSPIVKSLGGLGMIRLAPAESVDGP